MSSVTDDRFVWSRAFLGVLSVGFLVVAAFFVLIDMAAIDPEDHLPRVVIAAPAVLAAAGILLAGLGGRVAWIVSAVYGLMVSGAVVVLLARHPGSWQSYPLLAALLTAAAMVGAAAVIVAFRQRPGSREPSEMSA